MAGPDDNHVFATTLVHAPGTAIDAEQPLLAPGQRLAGYLVEAEIGRGGFGTVLRVRHEALGRVAVLKVLHAELAAHPGLVRRFETEARAVNRIRHPNVVDIYDLGALPDGRPYLVMEPLEGQDLGRLLAARGRLSLDEALGILGPVASALAAAHALDIVHRDVKASNVFVCDGGRVVLLDFGIAKLLGDPSAGVTVSRAAVGTPACMAPEQLRGELVDARADVYALAVLAYELLAGQLPFAGDSVTVLAALHGHAQRPKASRQPGVPLAVDAVIDRAMAADPARRTASVGELLEALRAARAPDATLARRSLAIYLDVRGPDDADDRQAEDLDAILPLAAARLVAAGFVSVLDTGSAALWVRPLGDDDGEGAVGIARALWGELEARPTRSTGVEVAMGVHAGTVRWNGPTPRGGELLRVAGWAAELPAGALTITTEAATG